MDKSMEENVAKFEEKLKELVELGKKKKKVLEIQEILKHAKIIRAGKKTKVAMGATVTIESDGKTQTYTVVGAVEANPLEGKISDESPIGKALLGQKVGDTITLPNRKVYKITEIS